MASIGARVRRKNARKVNLSEQCCKHESICGQRWKTAQRAKRLRISFLRDEVTAVRELNKRLKRNLSQLREKLSSYDVEHCYQKYQAVETDNEIEFINFDIDVASMQPGEVDVDRFADSANRWVADLYESQQCEIVHMVHMERDDFDELWIAIRPILQGLNIRGEPRTYSISTAHRLRDFSQFFITLFFLYSFVTWEMLNGILGFNDPRYLALIVHRVLCAFDILYEQEVCFPSDEEVEALLSTQWRSFFGNGHEMFDRMAFLVDGFTVDVPRPSGKNTTKDVIPTMKPGPIKKFVANVLVICLLDGTPCYATPAVHGAHDQREWNRFRLRQRFVGKAYGIGADGGFFLNPQNEPDKIIGFQPPRKPKRQQRLSLSDLTYYSQFAQLRVVVENLFSRLESWGCLKNKFRYYSINRKAVCTLDQCVRAVMVVERRKLKRKPLRSEGWEPKPVHVNEFVNEETGKTTRKVFFGYEDLGHEVTWD